ncbi:hypothetical protein [Halobacillus campisalis]|uniref:Uncharacterized protein n=1 Tax=Halobacillus campisalis TaxID=435909 RepID=A0ABW2K417_9BACI|nr:hypothetical protein [Halobacillus campisalis]
MKLLIGTTLVGVMGENADEIQNPTLSKLLSMGLRTILFNIIGG